MNKTVCGNLAGLAMLIALMAVLSVPVFAAEKPADVAEGRWSGTYITDALEKHLMTLENGAFAPERIATWTEACAAVEALMEEDMAEHVDSAITRGDVAALLYQVVRAHGEGFTGMWAFPLRYPDASQIPEGQYEALCWMTMKNVFNGYDDGRIAAAEPLTREQLAAILYRFEDVVQLFRDRRVDYSKGDNWAYYETDTTGKAADVFFVCPTVVGGGAGEYQMDLSQEEARASFLGATNMEKGIYDDDARFFAPYYRQIGLATYGLEESARERYLGYAYQDVRDAFDYYLEHCNEGRPILLAGFSQGADMCLRLLKDAFADEELQERLVACYAIGWRVTEEEIAQYPQLRMAQGEDDTGVVVAFNSEAEEVQDSMMIPRGVKTLAINPLNWETCGTRADRSLNLGACFTNYDGEITKEIPALTGAYLDDVRGALKVTDVTTEEYPAVLFAEGVYHIYDYQFFYRNLEKNVETRLAAYQGK